MQMLLTRDQACEWARHWIENLEKAGDGPYPEALESMRPEMFDSFLHDENDQDVMLDEEDLKLLNQMDPPRFSMADVVAVVCRAITEYPSENRQYIGGSVAKAEGDILDDAQSKRISAMEGLFGVDGILTNHDVRNATVYCDRTDCAFCNPKGICTKDAISINCEGRCEDEE